MWPQMPCSIGQIENAQWETIRAERSNRFKTEQETNMIPQFIAEVSSNHNRDLNRCLKFIDTAARIGCDGVKFQLFKIDELFAPQVLANSEEHRQRRNWELPIPFLHELASQCRDKNISFSCTPFYLKAVEELRPYVDFYKIASYELLWDDLLEECAKTGKPIVLSTGMATMQEINHAVRVIAGAIPIISDPRLRSAYLPPLTLLHCVSGYPVPPNQCNLAAIKTLRNACNWKSKDQKMKDIYKMRLPVAIGWSDHSVSQEVIYRAVHKWKASMIEFHLDLDGRGEEFFQGHCWLPEQINKIIIEIRKPGCVFTNLESAYDIDGTGEKIAAQIELKDRDWRADPSDGLRPLKHKRNNWNE